MGFITGDRYEAVVTDAGIVYSQTGTTGIELVFKTDEGRTTANLWLTEPNRRHVVASLAALGVADPEHFDPALLADLIGKRCVVTMEESEYNGRTRHNVQWINPVRNTAPPVALDQAARFFGKPANKRPDPFNMGGPQQGGYVEPFAPINDDDVPF